MQLILALLEMGSQHMVVGGGRRCRLTCIKITIPYPNARVASILTGPHGPCKYAAKEDYHVSATVIESLIPKIHSSFGSEITRVLALSLLWVTFEGETTVDLTV
jgi:hypothetical protein